MQTIANIAAWVARRSVLFVAKKFAPFDIVEPVRARAPRGFRVRADGWKTSEISAIHDCWQQPLPLASPAMLAARTAAMAEETPTIPQAAEYLKAMERDGLVHERRRPALKGGDSWRFRLAQRDRAIITHARGGARGRKEC